VEDRHCVLLAVLVALGALAARAVPPAGAGRPALALAGACCALAALRARPVLLGVAGLVLAAVLGARSWAGVEPPERTARWSGRATVITDPAAEGGVLRAQLRLAGGRHVDALAFGAAASCLRPRLAGEQIEAAGTLAPPPKPARARLAARHVSARLTLASCRPAGAGPPWIRAANGLRRTLARGATALPEDRRGLWAGLVVGDDRDQPADVEADFSAAGLTHLLAVSGQNVAFALAAAGPLLRRLGLRGRLVAAILVLALFGTAVRWEPSVLRATVMAALALLAGAVGVEASALRLVALAAAGLVLVDPMLVHRLGFRLSVAAVVGLALWARPLAARLPGPAYLRDIVAATLAAQAATAPVLLTLGGLPPASVPANALAVPAAGPIMVWGLTGGVAAGVVGGWPAWLVHLPSRLLLAWLVGVADVAARLPLAPVGVASVAVAGLLVWLAVSRPDHGRRRWALGAAAAALLVPSLAVAARGPGDLHDAQPAFGLRLWRSRGAVVAALDGGDPARVLGGLHRSGVGRIDLLVATRTGPRVLAPLAAVLDRHDVGTLVGPARLDVAGLQPLHPDAPIRAGPFTVTLDRHGALEVRRVQ
jgi:competence protein ComEC